MTDWLLRIWSQSCPKHPKPQLHQESPACEKVVSCQLAQRSSHLTALAQSNLACKSSKIEHSPGKRIDLNIGSRCFTDWCDLVDLALMLSRPELNFSRAPQLQCQPPNQECSKIPKLASDSLLMRSIARVNFVSSRYLSFNP